MKVSNKETAAIKEIVSLYGGTCTYAINLSASTKYGKTKSFEIEISNSSVLNENTKWTEMFAANIAYIFFTFVKDEKQKYNGIKSSIVYQHGDKMSFNYSMDTLAIVYKKMSYVKQIIAILKDHDFDKLSKLIKPGIFANEKDKLDYLNNLKSADSTFGQIIDFTPAGFKFNTATNGFEFLHVSGTLKRSKQDTQFGININPTIGEDELYSFGYDY